MSKKKRKKGRQQPFSLLLNTFKAFRGSKAIEINGEKRSKDNKTELKDNKTELKDNKTEL